jgi:hypothetical protein
MEPTLAPLKVFIGDFEVVHVSGTAITLHLGKHVHATIHLPIEHTVKEGDTLPLYTELTYANAGSTSVQ